VHRAVVSVKQPTLTAGASVLSDCYRSDQILTPMKGTSAFVVKAAKAARPLSAKLRPTDVHRAPLADVHLANR
jgi:hypothetical protein